MSSQIEMNKLYNDKKAIINKKELFCHSIDVDKYKILCENYFDKSTSKQAVAIAEEVLQFDSESEILFERWLLEWFND